MRLLSFKARNVHGYLDFNIDFRDDVTFLIGINGSGKTTAVRTIYSIMTPIFINLAFTSHEEAKLVIEHDDKVITIFSRSHEGRVTISTSETLGELEIPPFVMPVAEPSYRFNELSSAFYRGIRQKQSENEVFRLLNKLPTPMFLGIERKSSVANVSRPGYPAARRTSAPSNGRKNIFGGTLLDSLDDAAELAWLKYREIQVEEDKLKDNLRNALIMRAFDFIDARQGATEIAYPSKKEREVVNRQRNSVRNTLLSLGISEDDVGRGIDPFFERMNSIIQKLPKDPSRFENWWLLRHNNENEDEKEREATFNWVVNKWKFDRIGELADEIDEFVSTSRKLYAPIDEFLKMINLFFEESKKKIVVDRYGMRVAIGDMKPRDLDTLSSGEQQLVVLLTHLAFNPAAKKANVLIIDEPELSLHIAWQEMFVDALMKASPTTQFILATHSPSIILDRDENCQDLI